MKTKKQGRIRSFYRNLLEEFHKDKSTFIIYITLRTLVILIAVLQFLNGNYENAMLCVFTLLLFLIPAFVQATFRVERRPRLKLSCCSLFLPPKFWAKSTIIMSNTRFGTRCCTQPTVFLQPRSAFL